MVESRLSPFKRTNSTANSLSKIPRVDRIRRVIVECFSAYLPQLGGVDEIKRKLKLFAEWLDAARQHMAEGLPDEAEVLVAKVLQTEPSNEQAITLQQQVVKEKAERQKRLRLLERLQRARGLWTQQNYSECILLLVDLESRPLAERSSVARQGRGSRAYYRADFGESTGIRRSTGCPRRNDC